MAFKFFPLQQEQARISILEARLRAESACLQSELSRLQQGLDQNLHLAAQPAAARAAGGAAAPVPAPCSLLRSPLQQGLQVLSKQQQVHITPPPLPPPSTFQLHVLKPRLTERLGNKDGTLPKL
jgi:hypothetical protein